MFTTVQLFAVSCALSGALAAQSPAEQVEPEIEVQLLDNADFKAPGSAIVHSQIPWWKMRSNADHSTSVQTQVVDAVLELPFGESLIQPLAVPPDLASRVRLVVRGERGIVAVLGQSGGGPAADHGGTLGWTVDGAEGFVLGDHDDWPNARLVPRFVVAIAARSPEGARFESVEAWVPLACPTEDALRAEMIDELKWIFAQWFERGLDRVGPRHTAFLSTAFDAMTGEPLVHMPGGAHPFYAALGRALSVVEVPEWREHYDAYLNDLFELSFHPDTGLPRVWNVELDVPDDETPREIAFDLGHLLDLAEDGPPAWRERALEQAVIIGEVVPK